jgi:uncharacterized protein (TIGR00661 family)
MKIFYAVQATGNGHISRAIQLVPYLQQLGKVDVFLSGANASLKPTLPVCYTSKGLSLFYSTCGGLDYKAMWKHNSLVRAMKEAADLPVHEYDLVINDFDFITAQACRIRKKPSVQFGHQASFISPLTPRPAKRKYIGELILKRYAPATHYVGLHFRPYDKFIFPPVIKKEFIEATPCNKGYITVYLSAYEPHCLESHFHQLKHIEFQVFIKGITAPVRKLNITYLPVDSALFNQSLLHCHGIITGGGFETPAEALYLKKKLMCIPIRGQYEQECNAAALQQEGVTVLEDADTDHFAADIEAWLNKAETDIHQQANNIDETLEYLLKLNQ